MSIKVMTYVWEHSTHRGSALLLLLAIADMADDNGDCYPGVARLAKKTRMTERNTQKLLQSLAQSNELKIDYNQGTHTRSGYTNLYTVVLPTRGERQFTRRQKEVSQRSPVKAYEVNASSPVEVSQRSPKPSVEPSVKKEPSVKTTTTIARSSGSSGLSASPETSPAISQSPELPAQSELPASKVALPKEEKSSAKKEESPADANGAADDGLALVTKAYEANIGLVTAVLADEFKDALNDYPAAWIVEAIGIAVKAEKRFWKYVLGILKKWQRDGKDTPAPAGNATAPVPVSTGKQQYVTFAENPFSAPETVKG